MKRASTPINSQIGTLLALLFEKGKARGRFPEDYTLEHIHRRIEVSISHTGAGLEYRPRDDGPVNLYRATESGGLDALGPTLGWERYATDLQRIQVPGNHGGVMRKPHVTVLAILIKTDLETAAQKVNP